MSSNCRPNVYKSLRRPCRRSREDRYQNAQEMAADLRLILGHTGNSMNVRPTTDEITLDASLSMHVLDLKDQSGQTATPGQDAASKAEADVKTTSAGFPSGGLNLIVLIAAIVLSSFLLWKFGVFGSGESGQSIPVVGQETPVKTIRPAVTSTAKKTRGNRLKVVLLRRKRQCVRCRHAEPQTRLMRHHAQLI